MKKRLWIGVALALLAGVGFLFFRAKAPVPVGRDAAPVLEPRKVADSRPAAQAPGQLALETPAAATLRQVPSHPLAVAFGKDIKDAASEPKLLLDLFEVYRREFGSFPAGEDNPQMMHALMGANPGKLPIFPLKHPRLDAKGALLDAWGSSFQFHSIAQDLMEIRSVGPDREIFTNDDIVVPQRPAESQSIQR